VEVAGSNPAAPTKLNVIEIIIVGIPRAPKHSQQYCLGSQNNAQ
jgi:hypothetical protein